MGKEGKETIEIQSREQLPLGLSKLYHTLESAEKNGECHPPFATEVKRILAIFHEGYHGLKYFEIAERKGIEDPFYVKPDRDERDNKIYGLEYRVNSNRLTDDDLVEILEAPPEPSYGDKMVIRRIRGKQELPFF